MLVREQKVAREKFGKVGGGTGITGKGPGQKTKSDKLRCAGVWEARERTLSLNIPNNCAYLRGAGAINWGGTIRRNELLKGTQKRRNTTGCAKGI